MGLLPIPRLDPRERRTSLKLLVVQAIAEGHLVAQAPGKTGHDFVTYHVSSRKIYRPDEFILVDVQRDSYDSEKRIVQGTCLANIPRYVNREDVLQQTFWSENAGDTIETDDETDGSHVREPTPEEEVELGRLLVRLGADFEGGLNGKFRRTSRNPLNEEDASQRSLDTQMNGGTFMRYVTGRYLNDEDFYQRTEFIPPADKALDPSPENN